MGPGPPTQQHTGLQNVLRRRPVQVAVVPSNALQAPHPQSYGIWYMAYSIWYVVFSIQYLVSGIVSGIWYKVYSIWYMEYGKLYIVSGMCSVVYGKWYTYSSDKVSGPSGISALGPSAFGFVGSLPRLLSIPLKKAYHTSWA